jgi:SAM-dependent methyltransferase
VYVNPTRSRKSCACCSRSQTFLTERGLQNVEVIAGDARPTGLPEGSFDLVTSRLVLVTIPQPEQIIAEAVALARPGGVIAFHEADRAAVMCDPPSQAWDTEEKLFMAVAEKNGNDFHLGRKLPRLLREAGLVDVRVNPILHIESVGNPRRSLSVDCSLGYCGKH